MMHTRGQPQPQEEVLCLKGRCIVRVFDLQLDGGVDRTQRRKGAAIILVAQTPTAALHLGKLAERADSPGLIEWRAKLAG